MRTSISARRARAFDLGQFRRLAVVLIGLVGFVALVSALVLAFALGRRFLPSQA